MSYLKKCVVWDLDNTVWNGICLEGCVTERREIKEVISRLDKRGILHSIASRNEKEPALRLLHEQGLEDFFVAAQINWLPKSSNIITISEQLNIALDAIAFVDDEAFELEQVAFMLPDVMTIPADQACQLAENPVFDPGYTTRESRSRRHFYQTESRRKAAERLYVTREDFLLSCRMKLTVRPMQEEDINRVSELMTRTHQLNTTGLILDRQKLLDLIPDRAKDQVIFVAELDDRFGWNGIVGAAVVRYTPQHCRIIFFALSCRVLGRGIERAFLHKLIHQALESGFDETEALFKNTGRNRMMRALYQMSGFVPTGHLADEIMIFSLKNNNIPEIPKWVELQ